MPLLSFHLRVRCRHSPRGRPRGGFTLIELAVAVGILVLLSAIILPVIARARAAGQRVRCLSNLRQITVAFHVFADRNNGALPDPAAAQLSWETLLTPYTQQPRLFACPADSELYPSVGSSYDWRDTPDSSTTLAGQPVTSPGRSSLILVFESLPGWHGRDRINAARLDGSASEMNYVECMRDLSTPNDQPRPLPPTTSPNNATPHPGL
jgi:prepilin-type N-terminal cleavage/methylation domain-containing protein